MDYQNSAVMDMLANSLLNAFASDKPSRTIQSHKASADLNATMRKFGQVPKMPDDFVPPEYGDYDGIDDYQSALNAIRSAAEDFMELPSHIREEFANDPQKLLEFVSKDSNKARASELGLIQIAADETKAVEIPQRGPEAVPPPTA